ncbi:MAG: hypothetical protein EBQ61_05415 [Micrococcales bacterium]|nr:hypothetical protein [Micrococcales bacterium]
MRKSTSPLFISLAVIAASLIPITTASADNTWISRPSLSTVSLVAPATTRVGFNSTLSTQTTSFVLTYKGSVSDAGKFAQINFFDFTSGVNVTMTGTPLASPTGCNQQVLGADSHSCMFSLDSSGSAAIPVTISGVTTSSSFKYILLSGPNITQTDPAIVTFAAPRSTIKAVATSIRAPVGGAVLVRFRIADGATLMADMKVDLSFKGLGSNPSALSTTSDSQGIVFFYLANLTTKKGTSVVTAVISGTQIKATATVTWANAKY